MSVEGPNLEPESTDNVYDRIIVQTLKQHRLLSAHWELTWRCNEICTHCYLDVLPPSAKVPGELTTEQCLRVVDELAELGALNLTLSGGELLARRDWFEIAEYARSKRFVLRLFTNGILIKPAVADRIAALHPYAVEISLYGVDAESHEFITRRKRSFELTTRALRLLHERRVRTVLKTPLMHHNVRQFHALQALADELGAQFRYDYTISAKDSGDLSPLQHRLNDDDLLWLMRETLDTSVWVNRHMPPEARSCSIALNALTLDPFGNVFPCVMTRLPAGNVRERSLRDIWETAPIWGELENLTLGDLPVCSTCELRDLCARCHGLALIEDGDLRGPTSAKCREALARRQVLIERGALPPDYPIPAHSQSPVWWLTPVQELA